MTGIVKWFVDHKGYGVVATEDGRDVFCHHSQIDMPGFRTLKPGDTVTFDLYENIPGHFHARNIKVRE